MDPYDWSEATLGKDLKGQIGALVPVVEAAMPGWESCWPHSDDIETTKAGIAALRKWLSDSHTTGLKRLSKRCETVAERVGDDAQTLEGHDAAGDAHLVSALVAVAVHAVSGRRDEMENSLEDVVAAVPDLLEAFPETLERVGPVLV